MGISGLRLERREALKRLLADVLGGHADFTVVLVYDVSRWGRFQDPDQSAHYEFICREAGVSLEYCAETFSNDGSLSSTLLKHLKRAMAAEFSRELSVKVSRSQRGLGAKGFWQGGPCGYGLRRQVVSPGGVRGVVLQSGQHNAVRGDRVILVPGPAEEVETVRRIYRLFLIGGLSRCEVARTLNHEGVAAEAGARWTTARVRQVLSNEKYVGVNVIGKVENRLGERVCRPPETWIRVPDAFEPLVGREIFNAVQRNSRKKKKRASDAELLAELSRLAAAAGYLSQRVIQDAAGTHCPSVYKSRFGGLIAAYRMIGYAPAVKQALAADSARAHRPDRHRSFPPPPSDEELLSKLAALFADEGRLSVQLIDEAPGMPDAKVYRRRFKGMRRVYALAGYTPSAFQEKVMDRRGGQSISQDAAARLLGLSVSQRVAAAPPADLSR